jgi:hypothetical protein
MPLPPKPQAPKAAEPEQPRNPFIGTIDLRYYEPDLTAAEAAFEAADPDLPILKHLKAKQ